MIQLHLYGSTYFSIWRNKWSANPSVKYVWLCFLTVQFSLEWRTADWRGLCSDDALTASMFCELRTVTTLPPFFLTVEPVSSKLFTHVFMAMSWRKFTVSTNTEFLAKFTLGGNGAIVVLIQGDTHKKTETFERPNKNWRNPAKKKYWQKVNHYNLRFKRQ